jgi:hypothetical protein
VCPQGFWQRRSTKWSQRLIAPYSEPGEVVERAAAGWTPAVLFDDDDDYYYEEDPEPAVDVDVIATDRALWIHRSGAGKGETDVERLLYNGVSHARLYVRERFGVDGYDIGILQLVTSDGREWSLGFKGHLGIGLAEFVRDHVAALRSDPDR